MSRFIKICGLTTPRDVEVAVEAGVDAVGLVMTESPRQVSPSQAASLRATLPTGMLAVAVFHSPSPALVRVVRDEVAPDLFQATPDALTDLDGSLTLPVVVDGPDAEESAVSALQGGSARFLLDSAPKGGTGRPADWLRLAGLSVLPRMVLAGGLRPENVADVIRLVRPGGVDVSSGVESHPGVKDHARMRAFVAAVRSVDVEGEVTV